MAPRKRQITFYLPMRVRDAPTRLFHWALVVLIPASYVSAEAGWMTLHMRLGCVLLGMLLFRLAWGFIGSETARFSRFLVSPLAGLRYLRRFGGRAPDTEVGYSAACGWMVLLMLLLLAVEVGSGLGANDGIGVDHGPFAGAVGSHASAVLSSVHSLAIDLILAAIALHILAIIAYAAIMGRNLLRPMITGKKRLPAATRAPRLASPLLAAALFLVAAVVAALVAMRI